MQGMLSAEEIGQLLKPGDWLTPYSYSHRKILGSERESVKVLDLRCFLRSEIFSHGQCSTAAFGENGRNPERRYGNDAPGIRCDSQTEISNRNPRRLETRTQRGFPHFHSNDGCGRFSAMKINPAKIVDLVRFLHRTRF